MSQVAKGPGPMAAEVRATSFVSGDDFDNRKSLNKGVDADLAYALLTSTAAQEWCKVEHSEDESALENFQHFFVGTYFAELASQRITKIRQERITQAQEAAERAAQARTQGDAYLAERLARERDIMARQLVRSKIIEGVTTRSEIESLYGPAISVQSDGGLTKLAFLITMSTGLFANLAVTLSADDKVASYSTNYAR